MTAQKEFARYLSCLSDAALLKKQLATEGAYVQAKLRGDAALEAVLYFDIEQIAKETARRFEKEKII